MSGLSPEDLNAIRERVALFKGWRGADSPPALRLAVRDRRALLGEVERLRVAWENECGNFEAAQNEVEQLRAWQRSQPVEVTRGAIVDAIASVTDRWPEPLAEDEISEITTAVRAALRAALEVEG